MKKRFLTMILALGLMVSVLPVASALEGDTACCADTLAALNLIQGDNDGDYQLSCPANRAHAAVLLVRLAGAQKAAAADSRFTGFRDLPTWATDEISYAAHQGWIKGKTVTQFCPDESITADAWFTMLLRMLGYHDEADDFTYADAADFARRIGLASRSYTGVMTRGDVFESMSDALNFQYHGTDRTVIQALIEQNAVSSYTARALGLTNEKLTARQIADRHMAAAFCINNYETQEDYDAKEVSANASGFFISADGLAVTNYHSIEGALHAAAVLVTGEEYSIERVIYYDKGMDIAVIQVSKTSLKHHCTSAFAHLDIVGTPAIRAGDVVYTLGNPLGLGLAISSGIISDPARDVARYAQPCVMNTADISQGSSGGALLNEYGQVIAITSGAYTYGNNMYLAVPADPVLKADLSVKGWTLAEVAQREMSEKDT